MLSIFASSLLNHRKELVCNSGSHTVFLIQTGRSFSFGVHKTREQFHISISLQLAS